MSQCKCVLCVCVVCASRLVCGVVHPCVSVSAGWLLGIPRKPAILSAFSFFPNFGAGDKLEQAAGVEPSLVCDAAGTQLGWPESLIAGVLQRIRFVANSSQTPPAAQFTHTDESSQVCNSTEKRFLTNALVMMGVSAN